jgi:hypothetical protein
VLALLGFLAGHAVAVGAAAWVESRHRPDQHGTRVARASAPVIEDYVPRLERRGAWLLAAGSAVAGVALLVARTAGSAAAARVPLVLLVLAVLVPPSLVAAAEIVGRRLVDLPQSAASTLELAWDDALRARTVRDLVSVPLVVGTYLPMMVVGGALARPAGPPTYSLEWSVLVLAPLVVGLILAQVRRPGRHYRRRLWASSGPLVAGVVR